MKKWAEAVVSAFLRGLCGFFVGFGSAAFAHSPCFNSVASRISVAGLPPLGIGRAAFLPRHPPSKRMGKVDWGVGNGPDAGRSQ